MSRFKAYNPEQAYLLPPSVKDELGENHLCFFVREVVQRLELREFESSYSAEGGELYAPELMLSVWLYAYATGMTSARRLEVRMVEDLALRYLAAGERVDNWALSAFRRRHGRALNDTFTQVLEMARELGLGKLGRVAIDSTRIKANACRDRVDSEEKLRKERAKLRRQVRKWQKACDQNDGETPSGWTVALENAKQKLREMPGRLKQLRKSGLEKRSRTDAEARFLKVRGGFDLGYTGEIAVSDDHLIVAQRVTQNPTDNASLLAMMDEVKRQTGAEAKEVMADSGYFSLDNLRAMEKRKIDGYVPDSNLARAMNVQQRCRGRAREAAHKRMRKKLRSREGRMKYARRKAVVEPVFGVLKQQRGMRQFRTRGKDKVTIEFTLSTVAYNLTRMYTETKASR